MSAAEDVPKLGMQAAGWLSKGYLKNSSERFPHFLYRRQDQTWDWLQSPRLVGVPSNLRALAYRRY